MSAGPRRSAHHDPTQKVCLLSSDNYNKAKNQVNIVITEHDLVVFVPWLIFSPSQRSAEDIEVIYEELLHVKAAAHLSASVSHWFSPNIIKY